MTSVIIKYFKIPYLLGCCYITLDPETHAHQNEIWSCKLSLNRKNNIIQNITYQLLSSVILVTLWYICRVKQIKFSDAHVSGSTVM